MYQHTCIHYRQTYMSWLPVFTMPFHVFRNYWKHLEFFATTKAFLFGKVFLVLSLCICFWHSRGGRISLICMNDDDDAIYLYTLHTGVKIPPYFTPSVTVTSEERQLHHLTFITWLLYMWRRRGHTRGQKFFSKQ